MHAAIREILEGEDLAGGSLPRGGIRRLGSGRAPGEAEGLLLEPSGPLLVSRAGEVVWCWEPATRRARRAVRCRGPVRGLGTCPEGRFLAVHVQPEANRTGQLLLIEAATGRARPCLEVDPGVEVRRIRVGLGGDHVAAILDKERLVVARPEQASWTRYMTMRDVEALAVSPDGEVLFARVGHELVICELEQGMLLMRLDVPPVGGLVALRPGWPHGEELDPGWWVHPWAHPFGGAEVLLVGHQSPLFALDREEGRHCLSAAGRFRDGPEELVPAPEPLEAPVTHVLWEPGGGAVLLSEGGRIVRQDVAGGDAEVLVEAEDGEELRGLGLDPGGEELLLVRGRRLEGLRLEDRTPAGTRDLRGVDLGAALGGRGRTLVFPGGHVGSDAPGGTLAVRGLADAAADRTLQLGDYVPAGACAVSPGEELVATGAYRARVDGCAVLVLDVAAGRRRFYVDLGREQARSLAFSPDGAQLAIAAGTQDVRLLELERSGPIRRISVGDVQVDALAWHPDSRTLVMAGEDRSLRLWDRRTGVELRRIELAAARVLSLAFSEDGTRLATGCEDGSLLVWDFSALA